MSSHTPAADRGQEPTLPEPVSITDRIRAAEQAVTRDTFWHETWPGYVKWPFERDAIWVVNNATVPPGWQRSLEALKRRAERVLADRSRIRKDHRDAKELITVVDEMLTFGTPVLADPGQYAATTRHPRNQTPTPVRATRQAKGTFTTKPNWFPLFRFGSECVGKHLEHMDRVGDRMQALAVLLGFATEEQPVYVSFETVFGECANKVSAAGLQAVRETIGERIGQVETQGKGKAKRGRKPMTPEYRRKCQEYAAEYRVFLDGHIWKEGTKRGARKAFATSKRLKVKDSNAMIRSGTPAKPRPRKRGQNRRG